jgi:hypothetical protein
MPTVLLAVNPEGKSVDLCAAFSFEKTWQFSVKDIKIEK